MPTRHDIRKARLTPVVVSHDDWLWPQTLVATEVSPSGIFISGEWPMIKDEELRLSFRLGSPELFEFEGRVVYRKLRRRSTDFLYSGMGVELLDTSPFERLRMRQLLRYIPPPVPRACLKQRVDGRSISRRREGRRGGRRRSDPQPPIRRWGKRRAY